MLPQAKRSGYIPTLDGWRCIAISIVLIYHGTISYGDSSRLEGILSKVGAMGVLIFFSISGFLITELLLREQQEKERISLKGFYIRRFYRILPPAFAYLAIALCLGAASVVDVKPLGVLAAALFVANYFHNGWYTGHFWSLSVEEHFYIFWPSLLALVKRRTAIAVAVGVIIAVGILRGVVLHYNLAHNSAYFLEHTEARADYLMCGCLASIILRSQRARDAFLAFLQRGGWWITFAVFCAASVLGVSLRVDLRSLQAIVLAIVVSGTVVHPHSIIGRFLELPALRWVGRLSYSVYLWQELIFSPWPPAIPFQHRFMILPFKLLLIFPIAYLSYRLIERPTMQMGRQVASKYSYNQNKPQSVVS